MASIGKVALSLASAAQETTFALANFSFDFSVIRMDAAPEYRDVGRRLSERRKKEAEEGTTHTTARKLGALFADTVPAVPNLQRIYGLRASQLSGNRDINPDSTPSDGALARYIGLDATTIWAAATSGRGAIQVHLLACMLARNWTAPNAVAIWSEIVAARKLQLAAQVQQDQFHLGHLMASQIELTQDHLAEWDASARAVSDKP